MKKVKLCPRVLFNASVILAGLKSPFGGSAKLLDWCQKKKIKGIISEIILDEVIRNLPKIKMEKRKCQKIILGFEKIYPSPDIFNVQKYKRIVIHYGDAHLLASAQETKADFLATLDKKHLLILKNKIKKPGIVSPGQLIEKLS